MTDPCSDDDDVMYARSTGMSAAFGVADCEIKLRISYDLKADLERMAHQVGLNLSEFLRLRLATMAWGEERIARMQREQLAAVARAGQSKVPDSYPSTVEPLRAKGVA